MSKIKVLHTPIDVITMDKAITIVSDWALRGEHRIAVFCNVHSVVTAWRNPQFSFVISQADLAAPDGAPIAWVLRYLKAKGQKRIAGPDFMWRYLAHAEHNNESVFLYGGTAKTLSLLKEKINLSFPLLKIAGAISPPFRALTTQEDHEIVAAINASGASTLWVGLGCPKQEEWMEAHRNQINPVMLGVGAAFDYHAGTIPRAPQWMQRSGLEWFYRLYKNPKTLWRRYFSTNTFFIIGIARQLFLSSRQ